VTAGAVAKAFLFGALVAGSIGPIALLIFSSAAGRGFPSGAFAAAGAALADFFYALAAFSIGALILPLVRTHDTAIRLACATLLVALGLAMLLRRQAPAAAATQPRPAAHMLLPTLLLTLVNPMTIVAFAGFAPQLPIAGSPAVAAGLAAALAAGSFLVAAAIAAAGALLGAALPASRWRRAISAAAGCGIVAFGIYGALEALGVV
jgi:threonine/homoserine/homoserine lactone efflux protein